MSNDLEHQKSILLLEDNKVFVRPVIRWLKKAGYHAFLVPTLADALRQLEKERYHLAIVDLRLDDNDPGNNDGMEFLRIKDELGLRNTMPVIVLTANATTDNILRAFNQFSVFSYIEKRPGYEERLLQTIDNAFREKIQINFSLTYDEGSDQILDEIVRDIYWSDLPVADIHLLVCEMQDLFGKLFKNAERIYLKKLTPGFSGAGLVKAEPYWAGTGIGPARVVKVDRLDKSLTERDHYENFVKNSLPWSTTQVSYEQSQHLGGAIYSFAEDASVAFVEFDDFYRKSNLVDIEESLHGLILKTCRFWYAHTKSQHANLQTLYFKAFSLEKTRLVKAFKELLPDYDPVHPTIRLPEYDIPLTNPLQWLTIHEKQCILAVNMCITHGDMTGRNIMVDGNGKCWLIDFLRTYESHSLRDFVILETDLKYRLGLVMENNKYLEFEKNLIHRGVHDNAGRMPGRWDKDVRKLFSVIMKVRSLARQVGFSVANPSQMDVEYLISLLMATLNVIRLRHILPDRKLQAIHAANLICDELAKKFTLSGI